MRVSVKRFGLLGRSFPDYDLEKGGGSFPESGV